MAKSLFVLDSDVLIQAHRLYYAFDIAPRFWEILINRSKTGEICSIDKVNGEIQAGKDDLSAWARKKFSHAFQPVDVPDVTKAFSEMIGWVQSQARFSAAEKAKFANVADGWLVAYAKANGGIVVTQEVPRPAAAKVKIPDICTAFDVECIDTYELLRRLGEKLS